MSIASTPGHSSQVQIRLLIDQCILKVAQITESTLILRDSISCPPESLGRVVIVVDGHETMHDIFIDDGIAPGTRVVNFRNAPRPSTADDDVPF